MISWYSYAVNGLIILSVLFLIRYTVFRGRFFLHMFQQNGYKLNEFWGWVKQNWLKHIINPELAYINLLILGLLFLRDFATSSTLNVILSTFCLYWFYSLTPYQKKEKKKLAYTPRLIRLTVVLIFLSVPYPFFITWQGFTNIMIFINAFLILYGWIFLMIILPFLLLFAALIVIPVETIIQYSFKKEARRKIASLPHLKIIGITGSYGKTSTKFMIRDLLKERFNVLATPGSYNTPMGICKVINNDLEARHQVLVLEMGARYEGNIKELCEIAAPDISIITNIGTAHLETFGSIEVITKTKSEIIHTMNKGGKIIVNGDDNRAISATIGQSNSVIKAGIQRGDYKAENISFGTFGCTFSLISPDREMVDITIPLLGSHNASNFLIAAATAHIMGIRLETIALAAKKIEQVKHRLELKEQNGIYIIDDAFNSNPIGAKNAVDILASFNSGKRIIVTPGMIELGDLQEKENYELGKYIALKNLDYTIFVGKNQTIPLQKGYTENGGNSDALLIKETLFDANAYLQEILSAGDVILYENDLPDSYNE